MAAITPREFAAKWSGSKRTERAASQEHFIDLSRLLAVQTPNEADPVGDWYAFEKDAEKSGGDEDGSGFADVWKRKHFAWEYKGKKKNLTNAYNQLLQYREALENPPLLVVCDLNRFEVHTNFTNTAKEVHHFELADLEQDPTEFLRVMQAVMNSPDDLLPEVTPDQLTQQAAQDFSKLASRLRDRGHEAHDVAHFLNRLVFCLFAEDAGLLPSGLLERVGEGTRLKPQEFTASLRELFAKMSESGGLFGTERIQWFNGGLFDSDEVLPLETDEIDLLRWIGRLDWSQINPAIFGTLFERGLDPSKRSQLGAHYTDSGSIERVVEPVVLAPVRQEFEAMRERVSALLDKGASATTTKGKVKPQSKPVKEFQSFLERLRDIRVLDPACGSGNFLYVALRSLKDLEREAILWGSQTFGVTEFPRVGPQNVLGIELNEYAAELARVTIWIGEIQWMIHNGFGYLRDPILQPLDNIETGDALIRTKGDGTVVEAEWPEAEFVIGNPPFLGGKLLRRGLGDDYVDTMFSVFQGRVPAEADLVTYWFEKARACIESGSSKRAGLLATQGIRGGANRRVLDRIKTSGDIYLAWPDEPWVVEGATVHVSIVGFDDGNEDQRTIEKSSVGTINSNLTGGIDLTKALRLPKNIGLAFMGDTKGGAFDVDEKTAKGLIDQPNPDGRSNKDVVRPWVNSLDVARRPRGMWIIDIPPGTALDQAALYEAPFEYLKQHVKPVREKNKRALYAEKWWIHAEARPGMRKALAKLSRYIATPTVSKHRLFVWLDPATLPDHQLIVIAKDDDFTFGVLHSHFHELWARRMGTQLREAESGFRYTPSTTFETFPFPEPEPEQPDRVAEAARKLSHLRSQWLNPPGQEASVLKKRTLTNLYNDPPTWLQQLHDELDAAVAAAYGWPVDISDEEVLEALLNLNLERAGREASQRGALI
jgi:type II restriction/modification system DNA methylase subunit YeeA